MKKVIIFCQAAGDIKYTLSLYESLRNEAKIDIYLLPGHPAFQFVADLNLSANIHWIDEPPRLFSFKKPGRLWNLRRYVSRLWKSEFSTCRDADVYFFSEVIDWITLSMVARLSKRNRVTQMTHYLYAVGAAQNLRWKEYLYMVFFRWGVGASFRFCRLGDSKYHQRQRVLDMNKYSIIKQSAQLLDGVTDKFKYSVPDAKMSLLFVDSPPVNFFVNYEQIMREFLTLCEECGVHVMVKPHPRIPVHALYQDYSVVEIPAYVPGEFLPIKDFKCVGGTYSSLLGYAASQRSCFSIMNCFEWASEGDRAYAENILKHHSGNKIFLVSNLEDCKEWLGDS